jgi:hypothetical protein
MMKKMSAFPYPPEPQYYISAKDPVTPTVADRTVSIWRYMDILKFISLLDKKSLFFTRLDKLDDPFEGSITKHRQSEREALEKRYGAILYKDSSRFVESIIKNTIVNCWHMNAGESAAMWQLYVPGNQGIVVRSTIDRLIRSFASYDGEIPQQEGYWLPALFIKIGIVKYIDFDHYDGVGEDVYLLKRNNFKHEAELRAFIEDHSFMGDPHPDDPRFRGGGDYVPCDLETLIEEINIPPGAPGWIKSAIISLVNQYGFDFPVKKSTLDREPCH